MPRTAFPSPTNIRRQSPAQLFGRDAQHLFNNLTKDFEKQARYGQSTQSITVRRKGFGNYAAVWIQKHQEQEGQQNYSIDFCNEKLAPTGWRITGFDFKQVEVDYYYSACGTMPAIVVNMEYVSDAVCAAK